ncbi:RNA polymerase sigma factor [Neolewinella antarctica]|uniref:RNA polymerase sigma-70 factor (ECF subfamily) n=1 Tax=Neolewinella antarctica TaxID=442734 RepID=A0ABX0XE53_9BACT|nr:sigma-70 family RNA polymerase sigma factor [Neolewinella antarctica]NJC27596.1 RNA polymerase sigma-70 factor (ECF subfamily) [Neolewinella antarctica]
MQTDEDIMAAVRDGQLEKLAELYRRYRRPVYGYLVNRGNAPATAEDLLQTTFERVIKYRTSYRLERSFKSWVFTIARNAMNDRRKVDGRMPLATNVDPLSLHQVSPSAEQNWADRETEQQSKAALAALPDTYREVVELAWKRQLKYAEIATIIGTTEANVKVRMHRAVKQLRLNYAKLEKQ